MAVPRDTKIVDLLRVRAFDDRIGLLFEEESWTWREVVREMHLRARMLLERRPPGPFHVGVLLDNGPEFTFLLGAAALAGAVVVGLNPTRRGAELERDIRHTSCGLLISEAKHRPLLDEIDHGITAEHLFFVDDEDWPAALAASAGSHLPEQMAGKRAPWVLVFTSGTTGHPKAAIGSQERLVLSARGLVERRHVTARDVIYQTMPLFHSNAQNAWAATLISGATLALRRRFSASGFLPDVRRFGATLFNYVGKPLSYILATPEEPGDDENPLRLAYGNEATPHDLDRFAKRFGCEVRDSYGSTEGGITIVRSEDTPPSALGRGQAGTVILDPATGRECPPAEIDADGRIRNAEQAIGEIANREVVRNFEGYWNNAEADQERTRDGVYWSGDLGYRDPAGFLYFAGRGDDWMRIDGENIATAPIERILTRHPDIALAAIYPVPDHLVGDQAMAAIVLENGREFDARAFTTFLAEQRDLGTKAAPLYIRTAARLASTETHKILKRVLQRECWECDDPVWRREADGSFRLLASTDVGEIRARFRARDREALLDQRAAVPAAPREAEAG